MINTPLDDQTGTIHEAIVFSEAVTGTEPLSLDVARLVAGVELVSVDSMQVYRYMDAGTAKPSRARTIATSTADGKGGRSKRLGSSALKKTKNDGGS